MKRTSLLAIIILLMAVFAFAGCSKGDDSNDKQTDVSPKDSDTETQADDLQKYAAKDNPDLTGEIVVWSIGPAYDALIPSFNKHYPNVKVTVEQQGFDIYQKTLTAIFAGEGGPDVVQLLFGALPDFITQKGLENLLAPPYNAGQYQNDFTEGNWHRWLSLNGELLAMPYDQSPYVTYYNQALMDDYGYPSEPEEFGAFIQDQENWFSIAQTLKSDGKYVINDNGGLYWFTTNGGYFDENLNVAFNNDKNAELLDISKKVAQLDLSANVGVFDPKHTQLLQTGSIAMFYTEATGVGQYEELMPDLAGKWRATDVPFGANLIANGSSPAILSQSKNKEAAWAFVEYMATTIEAQTILYNTGNSLLTFKPMWNIPEYYEKQDAYLGGQQLRKLALNILDKAPLRTSTPFDAKAQEIWSKAWTDAIKNQTSSIAAIQKAQEDIEAAIKADKEELLKTLNQ